MWWVGIPTTRKNISLTVGVPTNRNENPQKELAIKAPKAKERCRCGGWGHPPLGKTSL
jgi:hypothetical protein